MLYNIVAWAVGLNARAEMRRRANGDALARQWIENRPRHLCKLIVAHDLGHGSDGLTGKTFPVAPRPARPVRAGERALDLADGQVSDFGGKARIKRAGQRLAYRIFDERSRGDFPQVQGDSSRRASSRACGS